MTEIEDNGQAPFPSENDGNKMKSFQLFTEPSPPDLTHCRVPLSAWFSETGTFCKRYFWRLLSLSLLLSILSSLGQDARQLVQREPDAGAEAAWNLLTDSASAQEESADSHGDAAEEQSAAAEEPADFFDNADEENAENAAGKSDADAAPEKEESPGSAAAAADCPQGGCVPCFGTGKYLPFFSAVALILRLMILGWTIRTIQKDDGAWHNLAFPSWTTIFKVVAALVIILLLVVALFFLVFGLLAPLSVKFSPYGPKLLALLFLVIFIYVSLKLTLSFPLIVDRDLGPLQAVNTSWKFMNSNCGTFFWGMVIFIIVMGLAIFLITVPLATLGFRHLDLAETTPDALLETILGTPSLFWSAAAYYVLVGTITTVWMMGFTSVFYLMATGQKRPGAWPRDPEPAGEPSENPPS